MEGKNFSTGRKSCTIQRQKGKCGYHQHTRSGCVNPCERDEWKNKKRCRRHSSSR